MVAALVGRVSTSADCGNGEVCVVQETTCFHSQ